MATELLPRDDAEALARDEELPVVARMAVEIRSDGVRTVARGAMVDAATDTEVAIELRASSMLELAGQLTGIFVRELGRRMRVLSVAAACSATTSASTSTCSARTCARWPASTCPTRRRTWPTKSPRTSVASARMHRSTWTSHTSPAASARR